ncbi:hypothetical protein SAMN00777080_2773 [Aquiflexum balticum DSM 16537]|uniref:Uncharacterized protein n=1 Tax=Aquiflexum balticum DSM 16537 TaxID=758820 RepID=A0A1W2H6A1_9BACT|nr:hypothetical protein SAMN00777080_2773 [Aquiflexum balticum DSM 16537]
MGIKKMIRQKANRLNLKKLFFRKKSETDIIRLISAKAFGRE